MTTDRAVREETQTGGPSQCGVGYWTSVTRNGVPALWARGFCPFLFRTLGLFILTNEVGECKDAELSRSKLQVVFFFAGEELLFSFFEFFWILFWILLFEYSVAIFCRKMGSLYCVSYTLREFFTQALCTADMKNQGWKLSKLVRNGGLWLVGTVFPWK